MQKYIWPSGQITGNIYHFGGPYSALIFPVNHTDNPWAQLHGWVSGSSKNQINKRSSKVIYFRNIIWKFCLGAMPQYIFWKIIIFTLYFWYDLFSDYEVSKWISEQKMLRMDCVYGEGLFWSQFCLRKKAGQSKAIWMVWLKDQMLVLLK